MSRMKRARPSPAILIAALALVAALAGSAVAGPAPSATTAGKADKALKKAKKALKIAKAADKEQGPVGPTGPAGPAGPSTGPAGGDLTGNYPNPSIAGSAVNGAKVQDGSLGAQELSSSIPAARVTKSALQSIPDDTPTTLTFNSERYDTASIHDNVTNPSRLTAPVTGIYAVSASVRWDANSSGSRLLFLIEGGSTTIAADRDLALVSTVMPQTISTLARLTAGEFVEAGVRQDSTGSLDVTKFNELSPEFSITWLAPGP